NQDGQGHTVVALVGAATVGGGNACGGALLLPRDGHVLHQDVGVMEEIGWSEADYAGSVYCIGYVRHWYRSRVLDIGKEAQRGDTAPNPNVISLSDRKLTKLLCKGRTTPYAQFRQLHLTPILNLSKFNQLVEEFRARADFIIVYKEEAHASDGWRFKNNYDINDHRSINDRMKAAVELARLRPRCPVEVDTMENVANTAYGGQNESLYVLRDCVVEYEGTRGPGGYKLVEVDQWIAVNDVIMCYDLSSLNTRLVNDDN
ncbi:LOW QUALITY PROTEIN: IOD1-like protein, partial [Mya arenaria]